MIPDFALSLSTDGICLLERVGPEWIILGQINLSDDDFDTRITQLRADGLVKSPNADQVKLVIPNEQIKYYSLARPADTLTVEIEALINQSLVQETPYSLSEITFDWVTSKDSIFVAAVTLQTLQEAENFAKQQGFIPLGNVAIPPVNGFIGEVFFGLSDGNQTKMDYDSAEISIATAKAAEVISEGVKSLQDQALVQPRAKNSEAKPLQTELQGKTGNIVFQSVRNVERGKVEKETVNHGKSALTLIAPIDQDMPQALASFKYQNLTTASLLSRFANLLYVNSENAHSNKNHNRLMNAGFLPAFILILATVCLVGTGIFYLAKPTLLRFTEQIIGLPAGPNVTIKLALPRDLSPPEQIFILSDKYDQSPKLSKEFLAPSVIPDAKGVNSNPSADLTSPRPSIGSKQELASQLLFEPDLKQPDLLEDYTTDKMVVLQPISDSAKLEIPKQYSKFQFIQEKLHRIYASSGIWSFSPKVPNSVGSTYARGMSSTFDDLSVVRLQISSLDLSIDFETDLEIAALEMLPTADINLPPQQTEIVEPNSGSLASLDSVQKFSAIPPVLPESIPQLRNILGGKPSSGTWLQTVATPIQEITLLTKPEVGNAEQQNQSTSSIGFTTLDKPERPSLLRLQPSKLSKHKLDNSGQSPTGRPLIIIRPIPRPTDGAKTISEQDQASVLRPKSRPSSVQPIFPEANEDIVSTSLRPKKRPNNIKRVKSVIVARVFSPEDEGDEANVINDAYSSTNKSLVSSKATIVNVLNLRNINLIGVYLSLGKRSALIRLSSGKRVMVKIGDKLDGGKVAAIGDTELRYIKRGQNITLELPKG